MQTLILLRYVDEMERGHQSSFSLESMGSRTPSTPSLLALRPSWPQALAHGIWPAALALFLSVSTSILIFPFFPYVPTSGYFGDALPQVRKPCHPALAILAAVQPLCHTYSLHIKTTSLCVVQLF